MAALFSRAGPGSLLWLIPWLAWMPRRISLAAPESEAKVRILDILRQRSAWGTCLGQFCINYCLYFLVTWLPSYLRRGRHYSMDEMARTGGLIFLLFAVSAMVSGKISDRWIAAGTSTTRVRKTMLGAGSAGLGVSLVASVVAPDAIFVWVLSVAGLSIGLAGGTRWTVTQTLAGPRVVGTVGRSAEFRGQLRRRDCPHADGIHTRSDRPVLLGLRDRCSGLMAWRCKLGIRSRPNRTGGLGEETQPA